MTEDTLYKKLIEFGEYRITNNKTLDESKKYDLFYFVSLKGEIKHIQHINLDTEHVKNKFMNSNSLYNYIRGNSEKFFKNYHSIDNSELKIFVYSIPRGEKVNVYTYFLSIEKRFNSIMGLIDYEKIYTHFKNKYIFYSFFITFYIFLYTNIFYLIMSSIGMPINLMSDINVISSFFILSLFVLFLFFTGIPQIIILLKKFETNDSIKIFIEFLGDKYIQFINYINDNILFCIIMGILIIVILKLLKIVYSYIKITDAYYLTFIIFYNVVNFIKYLIITMYVGIISLTLFFILFYPIIYISESHFNTSGFNIAKPKLLYTLYSRLTGYPKVLEIKDSKEKYILVGYDSNNYYVYNLKLTLNYVDNINESSLKLCKNLTRPINNTDGEILYEILSESEYNYPSNINFLNIKKSDVVILPFTFENINLSKDKIINNCNQLLKNKNK